MSLVFVKIGSFEYSKIANEWCCEGNTSSDFHLSCFKKVRFDRHIVIYLSAYNLLLEAASQSQEDHICNN